ncbi:MAG: hypothetical protein WAV07_20370 [Candidatus Contendobacter sp.]
MIKRNRGGDLASRQRALDVGQRINRGLDLAALGLGFGRFRFSPRRFSPRRFSPRRFFDLALLRVQFGALAFHRFAFGALPGFFGFEGFPGFRFDSRLFRLPGRFRLSQLF